MASAVVPLALVVAVLNAAAAAWGTWRWSQGSEPDSWFWRAVRAGQGSAVVFAAFCGVLAATGHEPADGLFWLYALLPLAVAFVAEQLRAASAQIELDARGLESAQEVGTLAEAEQRAVVGSILRREMIVMTCSCGAVVFLALRAAGTY
jgi:hypothetical protein